jgi:exodeoxyribonuclease VII large subunit
LNDLAPNASSTTKENPWPLSHYSRKFAAHIANAPAAWIEGEIVSLKRYPKGAYLKFRDLNEEAFLPGSTFLDSILRNLDGIKEGSHVVFKAQPQFWVKRGEISMSLMQISEVGVGDMLAKIEELKKKLFEEGLFDVEHKKPLPLLPRVVGLICGKNAQAKDDILENTNRRWNGTKFEIREVSVGNSASTSREVIQALNELDAIDEVDVIVIARGGGALEEVVFPFSDESLIRAVYAANTPIVSAIGHESDCPLLDFVADFRASTPTDAAKNIVPSLNDEYDLITQSELQLSLIVKRQLNAELDMLENITSRPILKSLDHIFDPHIRVLNEASSTIGYLIQMRIQKEEGEFASVYSKFTALNPSSTLDRGFAIVRRGDNVISSAKDIKSGDNFTVRFNDGIKEAIAK